MLFLGYSALYDGIMFMYKEMARRYIKAANSSLNP